MFGGEGFFGRAQGTAAVDFGQKTVDAATLAGAVGAVENEVGEVLGF